MCNKYVTKKLLRLGAHMVNTNEQDNIYFAVGLQNTNNIVDNLGELYDVEEWMKDKPEEGWQLWKDDLFYPIGDDVYVVKEPKDLKPKSPFLQEFLDDYRKFKYPAEQMSPKKLAEEYELILKKESNLSARQRGYVVWKFNKTYKRITI